jgi:hypothetical protein
MVLYSITVTMAAGQQDAARVRQEIPEYDKSYLLYLWSAENVRALEGLAVAARVSLRLARLPPLQARCGARVAYAPRLRLRQAFSRMIWSQNSKS